MKIYKKIGAATIVLAVLLVVFLEINGKENFSDDLKLKADPSRILEASTVQVFKYDENGLPIPNSQRTVKKYYYVSEEEVPPSTNEVIEARTSSSRHFLVKEGEEENEYKGRFFTRPTYHKIDDKWFIIETATTTPEAFSYQMRQESIKRFVRNIFVNSARAVVDTLYSGAGDGYVQSSLGSGNSWAANHGAANGTSNDPTSTTMRTGSLEGSGSNNYTIYRTFIPVDTSSLPDTASISSATLNLYAAAQGVTDNDGNDFIVVIQTTQANTTTLANSDYNEAGATSTPTEGSDRIDMSSGISTGAYNTWTLNATGIGWISLTGTTQIGAREGHDVLNNPIGNNLSNQTRFSTSEESGTSQDPYLEITYTNPPSPASSTGTVKTRIRGDVTIRGGSTFK